MKLTIKTLQQKSFSLDVEPEDQVVTVKEKIEKSQGYPISLQKLIFSGKILVDDKPISEYNISEKDFLVIMPKPAQTTEKAQPVSSPNVPPPATLNPSPPAPAPEVSPTAPTSTQANPLPAAATPSQPATTPSQPSQPAQPTQPTQIWGNASALVAGAELEKTIQSIMEMGFDRPEVEKALRASFFNPDRAGIPENMESTTQPAPTNRQTPSSVPVTVTAPSSNSNTASTPACMSISFQQLRQVVQQNPTFLQPLLQQIGQSNPQLLQLINANQQTFLELLNEGSTDQSALTAGEGNLSSPHYVSVTPEEKEAIDRLEALGFDRALAIEAFLACDRNEELAANYLFDHVNDE
ncbi:4793_t:CDS:2 [Ambispora leptoticha]|uniref:UV excision repair protein RAD23 n=1 Tax=Ambispora leptoticha TaxID=144679 RepID=A0A9N9A8H4_9GLOM|nr:4793_t:CDS:2 [Ambispora leptoticha]